MVGIYHPHFSWEKYMWEYAICERTWNDLMNESSLNHFGEDGWELVQVLKSGPREAERQYIFKRLKDKTA